MDTPLTTISTYGLGNWRPLLIHLGLTISALATFHRLEKELDEQALSKPTSTTMTILDKRFGYTETEVRELFTAWGQGAMWSYVKIELVDICIYFPGIFPLCLIAHNSLRAQLSPFTLPLILPRHLSLLPLILLNIDLLEDTFQLITVWSYTHQPTSLKQFVLLASLFNRAKWVVCGLGTGLIVLEAVALLLCILFRVHRRGKGGKGA